MISRVFVEGEGQGRFFLYQGVGGDGGRGGCSAVNVLLRFSLSEFSDENMMDVYNLAICFGPTLVPVPEEKDQVQYQNLVNDLIKNIILFHEDIFPSSSDIGGLVYEKYISREPDDVDVGDSPSDHAQEDIDSEVYPSEDGTSSGFLRVSVIVTAACIAQWSRTGNNRRQNRNQRVIFLSNPPERDRINEIE